MKTRLLVLLLGAGVGCIGAAPKERPRLAPVTEEKRALSTEMTVAPGFRSFDAYLEAHARRPVGLETARKTPADRTSASSDANHVSSPKDAATGGDILVLPTVEVSGKRIPAEAVQLADIEKQLRSGEKASEETALDSFLNPDFLSGLFGQSARVRAAQAKRRGELLGWQRILLLSLETEKSPVEKARLKADIEGLNTILRSWE